MTKQSGDYSWVRMKIFFAAKAKFSWSFEVASFNWDNETTEAQRTTEDTEDTDYGNGDIKGCVTGRPL
jgi:hypothetical protein